MNTKVLRIGLIMACIAMISMGVIGFTLAQFMTTKTSEHTAKIAKWGVEISTDGELFSSNYSALTPALTDIGGNAITLSVENNEVGNLVAPGTANATGITFGITGTPQVAVNVAITVETTDVYLKKTDNVDAVAGTAIAADYYPIVYKLNDGETDVVTGTLAQVETYLEALSGNYQANIDLDADFGSYTLTWAYTFDGHQAEDTLLGNIAAGKTYDPALVAGTDYVLDATFNLTITVTQID